MQTNRLDQVEDSVLKLLHGSPTIKGLIAEGNWDTVEYLIKKQLVKRLKVPFCDVSDTVKGIVRDYRIEDLLQCK